MYRKNHARQKKKEKSMNKHGKKNCRHKVIIPYGPGEFTCGVCGKEL